MVTDSIFRGTILFIVAIALMFIALAQTPAHAEEKQDEAVRNALVERTNAFCKAVLPSWLKSETGIQEPRVRELVTDCYMGQARLNILGMKTDFPIETVALTEVPAVLMQQETGINLDIFGPLAGRTIRTVAPENGG